MKFEKLEDRTNPATFFGTEGVDCVIVLQGVEENQNLTYILKTIQNGQQQLSLEITTDDIIEVNTLGGNDTVFNLTNNKKVKLNMGEGNDIVDGGEGGGLLINGGPGDDNIKGTQNKDILMGGDGQDSIYGLNGDDFIISDNLINESILDNIFYNNNEKNKDVVEINKNLINDVYLDVIEEGKGFDVIFNNGRNINITSVSNNIIYVYNNTDLLNAINSSISGDTIFLSNGTFDIPGNIIKNLSGITITGSGSGTILKDMFYVNNQNNSSPTLIENLTLDLNGNTPISFEGSSAYNIFKNGIFYLDEVEIKGIGTVNTAAVYAAVSPGMSTNIYVNENYLHDVAGDGFSTGGQTGMLPSLMEIYNTIGHTAGPNANNQVITAHFGFPTVVVGGHFYDAHTNVIAPDNVTRIDLYYVMVTQVNRNSGIASPVPNTIYGCYIVSNGLQVRNGYILENNTLIHSNYSTQALIQAYNGAIIKNNYIINPTTNNLRGINLREDNISIIDNVFEDWGSELFFTFAGTTGHVFSGNIFQ